MTVPRACPFCRRRSGYMGVSLWVTGTACPCGRLHVGPDGLDWILSQVPFFSGAHPVCRAIARLYGGPVRSMEVLAGSSFVDRWARWAAGVDVPPAGVPAAVESLVREASVLEVMSS